MSLIFGLKYKCDLFVNFINAKYFMHWLVILSLVNYSVWIHDKLEVFERQLEWD